MQKKLWLAGCRLKNNVFLNLNESLLDIYYISFKSPSFFGRKFSDIRKRKTGRMNPTPTFEMAALSSKSRNDRNFKISPVLIYYYPIASIALLILLRAVLKSKFLRSSGAKTSNNSVSIREFISLISSSDLPRFFLYLPKSVSASSS